MLRSPWLAPFNQAPAWDRLAGLVAPAWSLVEPRARVLAVVDEAPGVRSLWLAPNARFRPHLPGQHVLLELEIDGARHARAFSISSAPRPDRRLRLTIKRKPGGPVSAAAHALRPGDVVRLGQPQGDFAPRDADGKLLLVAAGSGITPLLSLLHGLADAGSPRDMVLVQCVRASADFILPEELAALGTRLPGLRVSIRVTSLQGRLDASALAEAVPDWASREALLCGPDGFMAGIEATYAAAGRSHQLQSESFGRRAAPVDPGADRHAVQATTRPGPFPAVAGQSLLEAAEAAGLSPRFGCRRGICRSCTCLKRSGTVLNLLTGQRSGPGEESIQLCISTPLSAIELAL